MVVEPLDGLELDALMFTQDGVYLDWGCINGSPLSADALRWVAHHLLDYIREAVYDTDITRLHQQVC